MAELHKPPSGVVTLIETVNAKRKQARHGYRVPASQIGKPCLRSSFYKWRWTTPVEEIDGRLSRLFQTGDREETRMIEELDEAGITVVDLIDGKQIGVSFADGHGYGFLDGEIAGVPAAPKKVHVLECKSHSEKSFNHLVNNGVRVSKPEHYAQCQIYMGVRKRSHCIYLAVNKNTDELYDERIEFDHAFFQTLIQNSRRIVFEAFPPPKIAEDPENFQCRFCDHKAVCHHDELPEVNCRTCIYLNPIDGGQFLCSRFNVSLKRDRQEKGCSRHLYLPTLINGEQVGADLEVGWITYAMPDGSTYENREPGGNDKPEG
jgi:hypothetical protein